MPLERDCGVSRAGSGAGAGRCWGGAVLGDSGGWRKRQRGWVRACRVGGARVVIFQTKKLFDGCWMKFNVAMD